MGILRRYLEQQCMTSSIKGLTQIQKELLLEKQKSAKQKDTTDFFFSFK
jgi:hypothetical protein